MGMNVVELQNVCIDYYLDSDDAYSIKNALLNFYVKAKKPTQKNYRAINDLSLTIKKGEKVGLIGLNGAGKTTLLRTIAGIFHPTRGNIKVDGVVCPLLDFTSGFEEYLTGIESIIIRLMLLGLSKTQAESKVPEIARFAELGEFIHQPMRTYSTGMSMRLAFATSTTIEPEILVADEVFGTGDAKFAAKAKLRLTEFLSRDCTLILSSHSMDLVKDFCNRIIWMDNGRIIADGNSDEVLEKYRLYNTK